MQGWEAGKKTGAQTSGEKGIGGLGGGCWGERRGLGDLPLFRYPHPSALALFPSACRRSCAPHYLNTSHTNDVATFERTLNLAYTLGPFSYFIHPPPPPPCFYTFYTRPSVTPMLTVHILHTCPSVTPMLTV